MSCVAALSYSEDVYLFRCSAKPATVPESVLKKRKLVEKLAAERAAQRTASEKVQKLSFSYYFCAMMKRVYHFVTSFNDNVVSC
jgi:hypothetical protein